MTSLSNSEATIRILVALGVGALIGLEREWRNKNAGFRTYALVCEGSALFMITSESLPSRGAMATPMLVPTVT